MSGHGIGTRPEDFGTRESPRTHPINTLEQIMQNRDTEL